MLTNAPLPILKADTLCVYRNETPIFINVSFTLNAGEALLLTGPNGAGKSTLLRVLAGLRRPNSGCLFWQGKPIELYTHAHTHRVAYLGHQDALKPSLSVRENLALFVRPEHSAEYKKLDHSGYVTDSKPNTLEAALTAMNILPLVDKPARMLSAGQKRRVALTRVLLAQAPLWLLDEPSLGLDHMAIDFLGTAIAQHRAQGGLVIAATHTPLPMPEAIQLSLLGTTNTPPS